MTLLRTFSDFDHLSQWRHLPSQAMNTLRVASTQLLQTGHLNTDMRSGNRRVLEAGHYSYWYGKSLDVFKTRCVANLMFGKVPEWRQNASVFFLEPPEWETTILHQSLNARPEECGFKCAPICISNCYQYLKEHNP